MNQQSTTKEKLQRMARGRKVVVWGTGCTAEAFIENEPWIKDQIEYFVDRDTKKQNTKFFGKDVLPVSRLYEEESVCVFLLSMYYEEMMESLKKNHFFEKDGREAYNLFYAKLGDTSALDDHMEELKGILSDEHSKGIVDVIRKHRISCECDYSDIKECSQYFVDGIIRREENAVFVDAGAYDGGTIKQFLDFQKSRFEKIYSFEMDAINYSKLQKSFGGRANIELSNCGLWDREEELKYTNRGTASSISESNIGDSVAKCVTLDGILAGQRVSFIKMDIEGAEIRALYGARESILKWRPQLAICLYHQPDDIWQIPILIHEWVPEYKLYIRHHSDRPEETILYAVL